jgi:rhodanese-related sulfurtransferase
MIRCFVGKEMIRLWKTLIITYFILVVVLSLSGCLEKGTSADIKIIDKLPYQNVTVDEVKKIIDLSTNIFIIDVRSQQECDEGHIPGSILMPVDEFEKAVTKGRIPPGKTVLIYCQSGKRSSRAADILGKTGYNYLNGQSVNNMLGGFSEWQLKGYPVEQ